MGLELIGEALGDHRSPEDWTRAVASRRAVWSEERAKAIAPRGNGLPSDAAVIGAVQGAGHEDDIVVCAAGGLPGELHKLWEPGRAGGYHLEYGFSCMGYEIAGALGVKLAEPEREVIVMVGDGSYLMMNSEIATSIMLDRKLIVVLLDNRGFGCIDRLQRSTGSPGFNNLLADARHATLPDIDFAAHARSLGARATKVGSLAALGEALTEARRADRTSVIVIDTDPRDGSGVGGHWWDVAVPEVSDRAEVRAARANYEAARGRQRLGD